MKTRNSETKVPEDLSEDIFLDPYMVPFTILT